MANAQVVQLKTTAKTTREVRRTAGATRSLRRQAATAVGIGASAVTLNALSLSHLAHGIQSRRAA